MINRCGYYLPEQDKLCGDPEEAAKAKQIYEAFGFPKACNHDRCKLGEACPARYYKYAGHYDGVTIFQRDNEEVITRVAFTDFFSEKFRVTVKDLPII